MQDSTQRAIQSLSEALRATQSSFLSQKRTIRLLLLFSALFGLVLGALAGVLIVDYKLGREFRQSIQGYGSRWSCENAGGAIYHQEGRKYCAIWINE